MKSSQSLKIMIVLLVITLAGSAFAADISKGTFQISTPAQIGGTTLPAGDYTAKWSGTGPTVQVSIVRNGKTVATVPAKLVELNQKATADTAETHVGAAGTRDLTALRFSGKKYSLELSGGSEAMKSDSVK